MAEADWDTVYLRKSKPKSSQLKSQQAVNAAQRQGIQVDTQKKSDEPDHADNDPSDPPKLQRPPQKKINVPQWKRKLRALHVGNLPTETTSQQLETYFAEFGPILDCWVDDTCEKKAGYTFGFVRYDHLEAAETAIEKMNNYNLDGRRLRVSFCHMTQNRLDCVDKMDEEELSKHARLLTEMKHEMEVQCRYYNDVYLPQLKLQDEAVNLEPVETKEVLKGIALYECHKVEHYNHVTGRVKLDLAEFDRLLMKEMPNRMKFVPRVEEEKSEVFDSMQGVRKTEEAQKSEVVIPGRGRPVKTPSTGRGAFLHSLLNKSLQVLG